MVKKSTIIFAILAMLAFGTCTCWGYTVSKWPVPGIPNTVYGPSYGASGYGMSGYGVPGYGMPGYGVPGGYGYPGYYGGYGSGYYGPGWR